MEEGERSRRLLLGRSQPFDGFIAPAHADQRPTEPIVHGVPRPITAIEPDRVSEKGYCLSRSPGFDQSKRKSDAIRYRVRATLQKSRVGGDGFVRTPLRTQDRCLYPQKPLRAGFQRTRPLHQAASACQPLLAIFLIT